MSTRIACQPAGIPRIDAHPCATVTVPSFFSPSIRTLTPGSACPVASDTTCSRSDDSAADGCDGADAAGCDGAARGAAASRLPRRDAAEERATLRTDDLTEDGSAGWPGDHLHEYATVAGPKVK